MNIGDMENTNKKKKNNSRIIKISIITMVLLLTLIISLIIYGSYTTANAFKVEIDGKTISNIPEDIFIIEGNNVKIQIKGISPYLGDYSFKNGQYGRSSQYTEDKNSCYLQSNNEAVSFAQN